MAKLVKAPAKTFDVADSYAVRLMQHLVVPTFVIDPKRRVVIWNRACPKIFLHMTEVTIRSVRL